MTEWGGSRALRLAAILMVVLLVGPASGEGAPAAGKLTLKQVAALIAAAPDAVVANELRRRGISESLGTADLARLQAAGAGAQSLRVLRSFVVTQSLLIVSNAPESQVFIDGQTVAVTDGAGRLTVSTLEPGKHHLVVQKVGYSAADLTVQLPAGKLLEVTARLQRNAGLLSVTTNASAAKIEIAGVGVAAAPLMERELVPGSYEISVSAPYFLTAKRTVVLKTGERQNITIPLERDPTVVQRLLVEAISKARTSDWQDATALAEEVLRLEPQNGSGLGLTAMAAFFNRNYRQFVIRGMSALDHGGELYIPVVHLHTFRSLHTALLKLRGDTLTYDPNGQPGVQCNHPGFTIPFSTLRGAAVKQDPDGQRYLVIKVPDGRYGRVQTLTFADYRATVDSRNPGFIVAPPDGAEEMSSLGELIRGRFQQGR